MGIVQDLVSRVRIEGADDYVRGTKRVDGAWNNLGASVGKDIFRAVAMAGAAAGGGLLYLGKQAFDTSLRFDQLRRGMIATMGSAQAADAEMKRLAEVAKLPGLGLEEAYQGSLSLQASGLAAEDARNALLSFGNAIAIVGGGKEDLAAVSYQLGQIASKTGGFGEDIRIVAEHVRQLGPKMGEAFGTRNTDEISRMGVTGLQWIKRMTDALATLPKSLDSPRNAVDNLGDQMTIAMTAIGDAIAIIAVPKLMELGKWMEYLNESDFFKTVFGGAAAGVSGGGDGFLRVLAQITAAIETLPATMKNAAGPVTDFFKGIYDGFRLVSMSIYFIAVSLCNAMADMIGVVRFGIEALQWPAEKVLGLFGIKRSNKPRPDSIGEVLKRGEKWWRQPEDAVAKYMDYLAPDWLKKQAHGKSLAAKPDRATELFNQFKAWTSKGTAPAAATGSRPGSGGTGSYGPTPSPWTEMATNTRITAENTGKLVDIRRMSMGGGELGRLGVTPVELGGLRRSLEVKLSGGDAITRLLSMQINQALEAAMRQGALR